MFTQRPPPHGGFGVQRALKGPRLWLDLSGNLWPLAWQAGSSIHLKLTFKPRLEEPKALLATNRGPPSISHRTFRRVLWWGLIGTHPLPWSLIVLRRSAVLVLVGFRTPP